ncbi:MAG: START domain-containing protein [Hahellaceae bacterium]|nr:START domain-containing protein [Hahellaceae bacterium]
MAHSGTSLRYSALWVLIFLWSNHTLASGWENVYDEDNITVSTRPVEGSSIRAFHAETSVAASVDSILALMADPAACPLWIHGCLEAKILDTEGFYQRNTYQINDMPWPVADRDLVLEIKISERADGSFQLAMANRPEAIPPTDNVRILKSEGTYFFTPTKDGRTLIRWEQHTDPGGHLPAWLVNQLIIDVPVKTLQNLRRLVESPDAGYAHKHLVRQPGGHIIGWETPLEQHAHVAR